jgi:hypothetical protein
MLTVADILSHYKKGAINMENQFKTDEQLLEQYETWGLYMKESMENRAKYGALRQGLRDALNHVGRNIEGIN